MFRKHNFTVKSSTNIRHSDRKTIFPESVNVCFNSKQQFSLVKVAFPNGTIQKIYVYDKEPLFFQSSEENAPLYPTVYFVWDHPDAFPILHIHSSIFGFIEKGSDLMIPGLLLDFAMPDFQANCPLAITMINEDENGEFLCFGPIAVGRALLSSAEMQERREAGQKGKAVEILHIFGDSLWLSGTKREFPRKHFNQIISEKKSEEEADSNDGSKNDQETDGEQNPQLHIDPEQHKPPETMDDEMDHLLCATFFSSLRWKLAEQLQLKFPIDAGQFYAVYILKCLPPGKKLDIKKTRYKKFSTFLRQINTENGHSEWLLTLKTDKKGVDSIESINFDHPSVKNARTIEHCYTNEEPGSSSSRNNAITTTSTYLKVREKMYSLTEQVMPLFRPAGFKKGDLVDLNQIRTVLIEYGQKQGLLRDSGKCIELDDHLQTIVKHFLHDSFPVNTVVQKIANAMTSSLLIQTKDGQQLVHRGKAPFVDIKIEKRMGNKVVTLVNNLASFGIDPKILDKEIKGTGTTILSQVNGCNGPQLLIQGNEINNIGRILNLLGLPKNFIHGLEQGIKEKKKKNK